MHGLDATGCWAHWVCHPTRPELFCSCCGCWSGTVSASHPPLIGSRCCNDHGQAPLCGVYRCSQRLEPNPMLCLSAGGM